MAGNEDGDRVVGHRTPHRPDRRRPPDLARNPGIGPHLTARYLEHFQQRVPLKRPHAAEIDGYWLPLITREVCIKLAGQPTRQLRRPPHRPPHPPSEHRLELGLVQRAASRSERAVPVGHQQGTDRGLEQGILVGASGHLMVRSFLKP
jgi:hypothetical protein